MGYLKGYFVVAYLRFSHVIERMLLGRLGIRESCMNQIGPFLFQKSMEEMNYQCVQYVNLDSCRSDVAFCFESFFCAA